MRTFVRPRVVLASAALSLALVPASASAQVPTVEVLDSGGGQQVVSGVLGAIGLTGGPALEPICDGDTAVRGQLPDVTAALRSPGATIARSVSGAFTVTLSKPAAEGVPVDVSAIRSVLGSLITETTRRLPLPCPPSGTVNVKRTQSLKSFLHRGLKTAVVVSEPGEVIASLRLGGLRGRVLAAGRTTTTTAGRVALSLVPTPAGVRRLRAEKKANAVLLVGLVDAQGHTGKPAPVRLKLR
jgi:hypothetical protein